MAKQVHKHPPAQSATSTQQPQVRVVLEAKVVKLVMVSYIDPSNQKIVGLAVVGDNQVHMLESRTLGFSKNSTPQGPASEWLRDGIFEKLAEKK